MNMWLAPGYFRCVKIKRCKLKKRGAILIISMIFVVIFSALAVSMATFCGANAQIADNQRKVNTALYGLECAKRIATTVVLPSTMFNSVTTEQADQNAARTNLKTTAKDREFGVVRCAFAAVTTSGSIFLVSPLAAMLC